MQRGHFALAGLMQDLARLRRGEIVALGGLVGGEKAQRAGRDAGIEPQAFERGDDAVAPERGRKPRHAGIGIRPLRRIGDQHGEVGAGAAEPVVERFVAGLDPRGDALAVDMTLIHGGQGGRQRRVLRRRPVGAHEVDRDLKPDLTAGRQIDVPACAVGVNPRRRRLEADLGPALQVVEPAIGQDQLGRSHPWRQMRAMLRSLAAAQLEQIDEIGAERDFQPERLGNRGVIGDVEGLKQRAVAEEHGAADMHRAARKAQPFAGIEIAVAEIGLEQRAFAGHRRRQQHRRRALDGEGQGRKIPRILEYDALQRRRGRRRRDDVAGAVENAESVALFQDRRAGQRCGADSGDVIGGNLGERSLLAFRQWQSFTSRVDAAGLGRLIADRCRHSPVPCDAR